jgi:hypothetical protein
MASMEMLVTPLDCVRVDVNSMELRFAAVTKKPSDCAATAAPKVQYPLRTPEIRACFSDLLLNEACAALTNPQESSYRE